MHSQPVDNDCTFLDVLHAKKLIQYIIYTFQDFAERLDNEPTKTVCRTCMVLIESYFMELSKIVQYDSTLKEKNKELRVRIKELNKENQRLTQLIGSGITSDGVSSKLSVYDDIVRLWYGALGMQYASLEKYTDYGIVYDFSHLLHYVAVDGCSGRKQWLDIFKAAFPIVIADQTDTYDIYRDTYQAELLDTDKNRRAIEELFKEYFPSYKIYGFHSRRNDYDSYSLQFEIMLTYNDIDALAKRIVPEYK